MFAEIYIMVILILSHLPKLSITRITRLTRYFLQKTKTMPIFYESLSDSLRDWALHQSMFFVSSAPLHGQHINLSPKGLPDSSFAVLSPNKVAYVDSTGSGCETICHLRENGRATVMFCSFDKTPRIMRLFCTGSVIEWDEPEFVPYLQAMGGKSLLGARAVIVLDIFKVS